MPTGGAVKLTIDADKIGYVRLPNGVILTTTAGVINTIYTGVGGRITYYMPKNNTNTNIDNSGITGNIYNESNSQFSFAGCTGLISLNIPEGLVFNFGGSVNFESLIAPKATTIYGSGCKLTAKSIGDILYQAYVDNRENVNYYFTGGTNAAYGAIDSYLNDKYSSDVDTIVNSLTANGGVITVNL